MYLIIATRPDIAFADDKISQFFECPTSLQWSVVKRLFLYIKGTLKLGICFSSSEPLIVRRSGDLDWAADLKDRKSTCAFVFKMDEGALAGARESRQ